MTEYNQNDQKVNTQFNIGRDQIIHNLVLVGQFLDFAKIEGLIPKPTAPDDFASIVDAFEVTFSKRVETDLSEAAAFVGEVIRSIISDYSPQVPFAAVPIKSILEALPEVLYSELCRLNYWNAFAKTGKLTIGWLDETTQFIEMSSLSILWKKYFAEDKSIKFYIQQYSRANFLGIEIQKLTQQQFRVFIVGLIVDLMRLYSMGAEDVKFWKGIVDLVSPKDKK